MFIMQRKCNYFYQLKIVGEDTNDGLEDYWSNDNLGQSYSRLTNLVLLTPPITYSPLAFEFQILCP